MTHKILVNLETGGIKKIDLTQEEIDFNKEQDLIYKENLIVRKNKEEQQEANKQSALNKLKALGLNDDEIKVIIG